jgi:predicted nucleic acid-binding protein
MLEVLLQTSASVLVSGRIFGGGETLHASHLLDVEIAHALRRYVHSGVISAARGAGALDDLAILPLDRYPHAVLLPRI